MRSAVRRTRSGGRAVPLDTRHSTLAALRRLRNKPNLAQISARARFMGAHPVIWSAPWPAPRGHGRTTRRRNEGGAHAPSPDPERVEGHSEGAGSRPHVLSERRRGFGGIAAAKPFPSTPHCETNPIWRKAMARKALRRPPEDGRKGCASQTLRHCSGLATRGPARAVAMGPPAGERVEAFHMGNGTSERAPGRRAAPLRLLTPLSAVARILGERRRMTPVT